MSLIICNVFSLSMVSSLTEGKISFQKLSTEEASKLTCNTLLRNVISAIGHADVAAVYAQQLDYPMLSANRVNVSLTPEDTLLVGQYIGPRLPEGATRLPEGASIQWMKVLLE